MFVEIRLPQRHLSDEYLNFMLFIHGIKTSLDVWYIKLSKSYIFSVVHLLCVYLMLWEPSQKKKDLNAIPTFSFKFALFKLSCGYYVLEEQQHTIHSIPYLYKKFLTSNQNTYCWLNQIQYYMLSINRSPLALL